MTEITWSWFWQLIARIIERFSKKTKREPPKELVELLKAKGFHFNEKEAEK